MRNILVKQTTISLIATTILVAIYMGFFDFRPLAKYFTAMKVFCFIPLILFCFKTIVTDRSAFAKPLRLILFAVFFSFIPAYLSWGQSFVHTFISTSYYFCFLLYFFLIKLDISIQTTKKILLFFCGLYVILYLFQFNNPEVAYFGSWSSLTVARGILRIIFPGEGFVFFGIVFSFYIALEKRKNIKYWSIFSLLCVIIFMQVTRQYLMAVGIVILIGLLKKSKLYLKIAAVLLVVISLNIYQYSTHPMIAGIREHLQSDMELKDEYIRVVAGEYFLTEMSPNLLSTIFGNGVPYSRSSYGNYVNETLVEEEGFYFFDLGLIGGYALFGILFVIGYLLLGYILFKIKIPPDVVYLKYYFIIIYIMSLTSSSVVGCGYVVPSMLVLYLIHKYSLENRSSKTITEI